MNEPVKIEGLDELIDALSVLPEKVGLKFFRDFNRNTLNKFIIKEIKSGTPYSASVQKSIKTVGDGSSDKTAYVAGVSKRSFWVRFVEGGTIKRETKKKWNRGVITARNRIKPIIERQIDPMVKYITEEIGNEINKALEKKLKRMKRK